MTLRTVGSFFFYCTAQSCLAASPSAAPTAFVGLALGWRWAGVGLMLAFFGFSRFQYFSTKHTRVCVCAYEWVCCVCVSLCLCVSLCVCVCECDVRVHVCVSLSVSRCVCCGCTWVCARVCACECDVRVRVHCACASHCARVCVLCVHACACVIGQTFVRSEPLWGLLDLSFFSRCLYFLGQADVLLECLWKSRFQVRSFNALPSEIKLLNFSKQVVENVVWVFLCSQSKNVDGRGRLIFFFIYFKLLCLCVAPVLVSPRSVQELCCQHGDAIDQGIKKGGEKRHSLQYFFTIDQGIKKRGKKTNSFLYIFLCFFGNFMWAIDRSVDH